MTISTVSTGGDRATLIQLFCLIYGLAGADPWRPPGPAALLERVVGAERIRFAESARDASVIGDGWVTLPVLDERHPERLTMACARALARVACARTGVMRPPANLVEALARTLILPTVALEDAVEALGHDPRAIAEAFVVPEIVVRHRLRFLDEWKTAPDAVTSAG